MGLVKRNLIYVKWSVNVDFEIYIKWDELKLNYINLDDLYETVRYIAGLKIEPIFDAPTRPIIGQELLTLVGPDGSTSAQIDTVVKYIPFTESISTWSNPMITSVIS